MSEAVLIRNSEDVEASTRNEVFGSVVHENPSRSVAPTTVAVEKYQDDVTTFRS